MGNHVTRWFKTVVIVGVCGTYLVVSGLLLSTLAVHHTNTPCPFMPSEETACLMGVFEHVVAWKNISMSTVPDVFSLSALAFLFLTSIRFFNLVLCSYKKIPDKPCDTVPRVTWYQELFSRGILNPKAP